MNFKNNWLKCLHHLSVMPLKIFSCNITIVHPAYTLARPSRPKDHLLTTNGYEEVTFPGYTRFLMETHSGHFGNFHPDIMGELEKTGPEWPKTQYFYTFWVK